jgi:hypothetical protein
LLFTLAHNHQSSCLRQSGHSVAACSGAQIATRLRDRVSAGGEPAQTDSAFTRVRAPAGGDDGQIIIAIISITITIITACARARGTHWDITA